jgi:hypothetical protein
MRSGTKSAFGFLGGGKGLNLEEVKPGRNPRTITTKEMKEKKGACLGCQTYVNDIGFCREQRRDILIGFMSVTSLGTDQRPRRVS